jgi:hypothetical protein
MACTFCRSGVFATLSRAAAKSAAARLRRVQFLAVEPDWARRAAICERCPLRVVQRGVSYCGRPFTQQIVRESTLECCGCPTKDKAKSPDEHCPLTINHRPAVQLDGHCDCKWCSAADRDDHDGRSN